MKKVFSILMTVLFIAVSCKTEVKKEEVNLKIAGMVCATGCAKNIETKLAQQEGVLSAKVDFDDASAKVEYDANKTDKAKIIAFIGSLAKGQYKACDIATCKDLEACAGRKKACGQDCTKPCCANKAKDCKGKKEACGPDCTKPCCADKAKDCKDKKEADKK